MDIDDDDDLYQPDEPTVPANTSGQSAAQEPAAEHTTYADDADDLEEGEEEDEGADMDEDDDDEDSVRSCSSRSLPWLAG